MRIRLALLLSVALPMPLLAESFEVAAPVTSVTLYPGLASVSRTVAFTAPAGTHEIVVPDLPWTAPEALRVIAPEGVTVGAVSLSDTRQPVTADQTSTEYRAAEAEVQRLEAVLREKHAAIAAIRARGEAAAARAAFLQGLAATKGEGLLNAAGIEDLRALAALVGDEVLAARQVAVAAEAEATTAEIALRPDVEAIAKAKAALEALTAPPEGETQVLTLTVATEAEGEVALEVVGVTSGGWRPVYDIRLSRGPDAIVISRGVMVAQATGEDWRDVALSISTSRPSEQSAPSAIWPDLRRIEPEVDPETLARNSMGYAGAAPMMEAPVMEAAVAQDAYSMETQGLNFTYSFTASVTIRSGADELRLVMDDVTPEVAVRAEAVPFVDTTAFLVAEVTNTTGQPLLPGEATLYSDGALVGMAELPLIAQGADETIGFGAIEGLLLTRIVPQRSEGEQGIITSSNRREEVAVIGIENLTGEAWPVKLTDRVPYSEQDDLEISYTADPPPTETDPEGQRGLLVWEFEIAPAEKREIRLESEIEWPDGMELR